jgi:hypothetical protein
MRYRNELVIVGLWISAVATSLLLVLVSCGKRPRFVASKTRSPKTRSRQDRTVWDA